MEKKSLDEGLQRELEEIMSGMDAEILENSELTADHLSTEASMALTGLVYSAVKPILIHMISNLSENTGMTSEDKGRLLAESSKLTLAKLEFSFPKSIDIEFVDAYRFHIGDTGLYVTPCEFDTLLKDWDGDKTVLEYMLSYFEIAEQEAKQDISLEMFNDHMIYIGSWLKNIVGFDMEYTTSEISDFILSRKYTGSIH